MNPSFSRRVPLAGLLAAVLCSTCGCGIANLLMYPFAPREAKRTVRKEHDLVAERLLILPYAGTDILFEFEGADIAVANHVIREMAANIPGRTHRFINPAEVRRYQQSNLDWPNLSLQQIGREFGADKVLYIEIRRFSMMEERSANLYRGRITAAVQVVDANAARNDGVEYKTDIAVEFPEDHPLGTVEVNRAIIEQATMRQFAVALVRKFYDHEEKVVGGR